MKLRHIIFLTVLIAISNNASAQNSCVTIQPGEPISVISVNETIQCVKIVNTTGTSKLKYLAINNGNYYPTLQHNVAYNLGYQLIPSKEEKVRASEITIDPRNSAISIYVGKSPRKDQSDYRYTVPHIYQFYLDYSNNIPVLMVNVDALLKTTAYNTSSVNSSSLSSSISSLPSQSYVGSQILTSTTTDAACDSQNTSPENVPSVANLNKNVAYAESIKLELQTGTIPNGDYFKYLWFYFQVRGGSPWDFKQLDPSLYADFGNYNYGAVGAALDIPDQVLLRGAGWAQIQAGTSGENWGHYLGSAPYGDDPVDQEWIQKGINYYKEVIAKKSLADRLNGGLDKKDDCNPAHNTEPGAGGGGGGGGDHFYDTAPGSFYIPHGITVCFIYNCSFPNVTVRDL